MVAQKNILLFTYSKSELGFFSLCYEGIKHGLQALGEKVVLLDTAKPEDSRALEEAIREGVSFAMGYWGMGANIKLGETWLADALDVPFVSLMTDDMLFNLSFNGIHVPAKHLLIGCLNQHEIPWIQRENPQAQVVSFLPIAGSRVDETMPVRPIAQRKWDFVFCGKCHSSTEQLFTEAPGSSRKILRDCIDLVLADPMVPLIVAISKVFKERGAGLSQDTFRAFCLRYGHPLTVFIRNYCRRQVLKTLIENGVDIDIFGTGWDSWEYAKKARLHGPCSYKDSLALAADTKLLLNVGMFPSGLHDRVVTGMLNGAVVVTDTSRYYEQCFHSGDDSLGFTWDRLAELPGQILELQGDEARMQAIADRAQRRVQAYTWTAQMKRLLDIVHTYKAIHDLEKNGS